MTGHFPVLLSQLLHLLPELLPQLLHLFLLQCQLLHDGLPLRRGHRRRFDDAGPALRRRLRPHGTSDRDYRRRWDGTRGLDGPQIVRIIVVVVIVTRVVTVLVVVVDDVLPRDGADGPLRPASVVGDAFSAVLCGDEPRAARIVAGQGGAPVGIPAHA